MQARRGVGGPVPGVGGPWARSVPNIWLVKHTTGDKIMSKQTDKQTVNRGAGKVATAISRVYDSVENSGNVVTQCVTAARQVYRGKAIPKIDLSYIADNVARIRKWSPASLKQRKSEVRVVLRAYDRLPEAIEKYTKSSDGFTWHDAIKLSRCLGAEPSMIQALKRMNAKATGGKITAPKAIGAAVSRIMNVTTGASRLVAFQAGLEVLAEKHAIDW